jgi:hypothetical protein
LDKIFLENLRFPHSGTKIVNNSAFSTHLNSMFKYLLTGLLCLCGIFCYSQEEASFTAAPEVLATISPDTLAMNDALSLVVRDNAKTLLSWKVLSSQNEYFSIERSCNGKDFETIAVIKQVSGVGKMEWTDEQPVKGKNIYRVRYSFYNGVQWYTKTVVAVISGAQSFRFYPNPAEEIIIIRSEQAIDVSIIDGAGKTRIAQTLQSGLQTLNVSTLEKGVYVLRVYNRQTNNYFLERLVKN